MEALHAGVEQFSNGQYEKAIDNFKDAKRFDPDLLNARLYLGAVYASEYIPGGPSDENRENGELAVAEFRNVLALDAENLAALDALGSLDGWLTIQSRTLSGIEEQFSKTHIVKTRES